MNNFGRASVAVLLLFGFCAAAFAGEWTYYPSDEFNDANLRPRWLIGNTGVAMQQGMLVLTNPNSFAGGVTLRSVYNLGTKIPLQAPWAMETRMVCPFNDSKIDSPVAGGMEIRLGNDNGFAMQIKAGRSAGYGVSKAFCLIDGAAAFDPPPAFQSDAARELCIRAEGVGDEGRAVRIGFRLKPTDPWTWSPERKLAQPVTHAAQFGFFSEPAPFGEPTGEKMSVGFDYVHFEGKCFEFGEKEKPNYVRPNPPPIALKPPQGRYYQAEVPDTIDFAQRSDLALNALLNMTDPTADDEPYCHVWFNPGGWNPYGPNAFNVDMERNAPVMVHDYHGYNCATGEEAWESIPLLWLASGRRENFDTGARMLHNLRRMIDEGGSSGIPIKGRPWAFFLTWWIDNPLSNTQARTGQIPGVGMPLQTLTALNAYQPDPQLEKEIKWFSNPAMALSDQHSTATYNPVRPLDLNLEGARGAIKQFGPDGSYPKGPVHIYTQTLLSIFDAAFHAHDTELLEKVRKGYLYGISQSWPTAGLVPENIGARPVVCETCALAELLLLGIRLSRAGVGDFWDDVDRFSRNQFAEQQLVNVGWINEVCKEMPHWDTPTPPNYPGTTDVANKIKGGFSSYGTINQWTVFLGRAPGGPVGCCTGNGALTTFHIWNNILNADQNGLNINLLMNRASQWADVNSFIPFEGRVEIELKQSMPLRVRIPEWVSPGQVHCTVDQQPHSLTFAGRFAIVGNIDKGSRVGLTFPISVKQVHEKIGDVDCELTIKGNTIVKIDPPGKICPIYQREAYLADAAPLSKVTRFVAERTVDW